MASTLHFDEVIPAVAANLVVVCEPLDKKAILSANFPYNATVTDIAGGDVDEKWFFIKDRTPANQVTFIQFDHFQPRS
jgi:hypothetical protein